MEVMILKWTNEQKEAIDTDGNIIETKFKYIFKNGLMNYLYKITII